MAITESESQEKLLNLVINNQELIPIFLSKDYGPEHFDPKYRPLVYAIEESHIRSQIFTQNYFLDFVQRSVGTGDYKKWTGNDVASSIIAHTNENRIFQLLKNLEKTDKNDFELICRKVREHYVKVQSGSMMSKFQKEQNNGYLQAVQNLSENLNILVSGSSEGNSASWASVDEFGEEWIDSLEKEALNPKKILSTGIGPFDQTMPMGLSIGSLTLIVADVGGFKSASMINIALNVCKISNENVLYVSLEMPKDMLMTRIISRESCVPSENISKPQTLSSDQKNKIKDAVNSFRKISSKFAIIDAQERMTVSKIRAELEKRKHFFKPRLVVVDYISILSPETWYQKLAEHSWYGQMCKDLRQLGRKMGFGVLSAVQLNREAIKSLRNQKDGKQSVGSDALRGSHDFSADADNIFVQFPSPDQPKERLFLFCVKSRYGSTMFGSMKNQTKATLEVHPNIGKIEEHVDASWSTDFNNSEMSEFIKKADEVPSNPDIDLDFSPTPPSAPISKKPKAKQMTDAELLGL